MTCPHPKQSPSVLPRQHISPLPCLPPPPRGWVGGDWLVVSSSIFCLPPPPGSVPTGTRGGWGWWRQAPRTPLPAISQSLPTFPTCAPAPGLSHPPALHAHPPPASPLPTPRDFPLSCPHSHPTSAHTPPLLPVLRPRHTTHTPPLALPTPHHHFPPHRARHSHTSPRNPHHLIGANNPSTKQNFQSQPPSPPPPRKTPFNPRSNPRQISNPPSSSRFSPA